MTKLHHAWLTLLGALLLQEAPERLSALLPHPLNRIARSQDWQTEAVKHDATLEVSAALVKAGLTSSRELSEAIQTLELAAALDAYREHRKRMVQAELRSMALVRKSLERALGDEGHAWLAAKRVA